MFENDFVTTKPDLKTYVTRLQRWRDRYEAILDRKAKKQHLESTSHWLVEFQYYKFDEIEVPGQYLQVSTSSTYLSHCSHGYLAARGLESDLCSD
jgi:transformation/transcription domain-associated protein